MDHKEISYYYKKFKFGEDIYHNLMKKRVKRILLVSTFYDAFIFEQDGRLSEQIHGEYRQLNLSTAPRIISVPTGVQALKMLKESKFDLVITMMRIGEIGPVALSKKIHKLDPDLPVLLLLNVSNDLSLIDKDSDDMKYIENVFNWNGDSKIFLTMIKYIEDKWNVENDTREGAVQVILLVEDSIHYYSVFHPLLYAEILKQTQKLIIEELDDMSKRRRMRGRPKVLLCHTYEDAVLIYEKYKDNIIGVISDISYKVNDKLDSQAGLKLIKHLREQDAECPILLQSSEADNKEKAEELNVHFLNKTSKKLLFDLREFILKNMGFGVFIFRDRNGNNIARAETIQDFEMNISNIPAESLIFHSENNHFSAWLTAHGEVEVARRIKHLVIKDFESVDQIRHFLLDTFSKIRKEQNKGKVVAFNASVFQEEGKIIQLADGSLGGKGRGLAFLNAFLTSMEINEQFDDIDIKLPQTAIIGTNEYDSFIEENDILVENIIERSDQEINEIFLAGDLSSQLQKRLTELINVSNTPLAVRSSGLLEDSQSQPFAGVYETYMLPNNEKNPLTRLDQLMKAVKLVFASPFRQRASNYLNSINYSAEEEEMAVIIQQVVGSKYDDLFFPEISGTAQSYNFYPIQGMKHEDGIASLAVGLGKEVVDGGLALRFCPKYPRIDLQKPAEIVKNSQRNFYALDLKREYNLMKGEDATLDRIKISAKFLQSVFRDLASVWDHERLSFNESSYAKGPLVLTFRKQVHYDQIRISKILEHILEIGKVGLGVPVEIEFALSLNPAHKPCFYLLQIRPLSVHSQKLDLNLAKLKKEATFLLSSNSIGNGQIDGIKDIVFVDPDKFDNTKTFDIASEVEKINLQLRREEKPFILIGPGRWGTSDRFLGIPVRWAQINMAKVIVETSLDGFVVEASQGSHFFHNLVAMNIAYLTTGHNIKGDHIDWEWIRDQQIRSEMNYVTHVELSVPSIVKIDGRSGKAAFLKNS